MTEDLDYDFNTEGDIHFRDQLQFELKSEFLIHPNLDVNFYKQEIYLFVPQTLQINSFTYSKADFYSDQTNLIRYKTPELTLEDLIDPQQKKSPLIRLKELQKQPWSSSHIYNILDELRLLGNIFKASLRKHIHYLIQEHQYYHQTYYNHLQRLCEEIRTLRNTFIEMQVKFLQFHFDPQLRRYFRYTDEYLSSTIDHELTILLNYLQHSGLNEEYQDLISLIIDERHYRNEHQLNPKTSTNNPFFNEAILYRRSLLDKFMLEALSLKSNRQSFEERHGHLLGSLAAGIAMFIYMILFWQSTAFRINSLPIVILVVFFYVLKDRLKEAIKTFYYRQAPRWFPDYATFIETPKGEMIGQLTENFTFIEPSQLPIQFLEIRNQAFHEELQALQRPETILHYKREVMLRKLPSNIENRRRELTMIFRFNIQRFLKKANDAFQPYLQLDEITNTISKQMLPKVYHLNMIIRNIYFIPAIGPTSEIKTFRVVIDKNGIKRVEQIG